VHELVVEQALRTPEAIAVANGDDQLTYAELVDRARALALLLRARGVGPEVTIALSGDGNPRLFVGLLAVLMAGGAYVPMDPTYPVKRLEYMAENSGVALLLTERKLVDRLPALVCPSCAWTRTTTRPSTRRHCRSRAATTSPTSSTRQARPVGPRACWSSTEDSSTSTTRIASRCRPFRGGVSCRTRRSASTSAPGNG